MKKWNVINLVPLNPNVTLAEKDGLKRLLFQNDDLLLTTVTSKKFQDLLLTDQQNRKVKTLLQNILILLINGQRLNVRDRKRGNFQMLHQPTSIFY
jgi:hypothetical protein